MDKVTFLPAFDKRDTIKVGDHFEMKREPDNEHDKAAVAVYRDKELVGYIATSANTVAFGTLPARSLFKKMGNKKLGEAWVTLESEITVKNKDGRDMLAFVGKSTFIPVIEQKQVEVCDLVVTGSMISEAFRSRALDQIKLAIKDNSEMPTFYVQYSEARLRNNKKSAFYVVPYPMTEEEGDAKSIGEILNPPASLKSLLTRDGSVPIVVKGLCDKFGKPLKDEPNKTIAFHGEVSMKGGTSDKLKDAMLDVVRRGKDLFSSVEKKVDYMTKECVPEKVILATLANIQTADPDWEGLVPHPTAVFRQSTSSGELTRCLAYRCSGMNLRLVGNKGAGKNTLIETVDWLLNRPQYRIQGNAEMDKMDLLGSPTLKDGNMDFQLSDMIKCLMAGGNVVLDEGNTVRPEVADLLHSLTDESRQIQIPGYGLIKRHPYSSLTLTMNEDYMGTTKMNEATVDRFTPIQMDQPVSIAQILTEAVPSASKNDIKTADKIYVQIRQKISGGNGMDGTLEPDCMTIRGFIDALRSAPLLGLKDALLDNVAAKPQDMYSRAELREVVLANCS